MLIEAGMHLIITCIFGQKGYTLQPISFSTLCLCASMGSCRKQMQSSMRLFEARLNQSRIFKNFNRSLFIHQGRFSIGYFDDQSRLSAQNHNTAQNNILAKKKNTWAAVQLR